jgi:CheY-like chemotaxis protein
MPARILVVDDSPTVLKIVERTLLRAGYEVSVASDGQEGLEEAQRLAPDLVLVDFVMPRMNGFQMTTALRGIANLAHLPVVLMSARAEKIGAQFTAQTGAADAISKPFSPEALLAVVAHTLERAPRTGSAAFDLDTPDEASSPTLRVSTPPPAADATGPQRVSSLPPPAERGPSPDALRRQRERGARRAAEALAAAIAPALQQATGVELATSTLADALLADGVDAFVERLDDASARSPGPAGLLALEGRIEHVGLGDVLQLMQMQQQTGVLELEYGRRSTWVALRGGLVDLASTGGPDPEFLLGRYLVEEELLEREDLDHLLRSRVAAAAGTAGRKLLGDQLVKLGYISTDDLRRALVRQSSEVVYDALRWREGRYRFARYASRPEAEAARLGLPIASILMEGLRRVDEWRLIEEQIHDFELVFERNTDVLASLDLDALSREERVVLACVDGRRTVRAILEETRTGSFDCCKALFRLATARIIRRVRRTRSG